MVIVDSIQQPTTRTTKQALETILRNAPPEEMDIAAAYITGSGLRDFLDVVTASLEGGNAEMVQRWLTSFDYCRTEPIALETIMSLPNSEVRIYDAEFCISKACMPRVPFHPKTFFFRSTQFDYVLSGSGNISRSGLSRGYEAGLSLGIDRQAPDVDPAVVESINASRNWFSDAWEEASPLTDETLSRYIDIFESVEKRNNPSSTEDDIATDHPDKGSLKFSDLQRLRVCRYFWIEAGNVTRNRGPGHPGNQLMMKRLSRVYFGFSPIKVPENSYVGDVDISFNGSPYETYSLTYSDNKMDKLVLPIPGNTGPDEYDNKVLLFKCIAPGRFELDLGSDQEKKEWIKRSKKIQGHYLMKSGRQWGVF